MSLKRKLDSTARDNAQWTHSPPMLPLPCCPPSAFAAEEEFLEVCLAGATARAQRVLEGLGSRARPQGLKDLLDELTRPQPEAPPGF